MVYITVLQCILGKKMLACPIDLCVAQLQQNEDHTNRGWLHAKSIEMHAKQYSNMHSSNKMRNTKLHARCCKMSKNIQQKRSGATYSASAVVKESPSFRGRVTRVRDTLFPHSMLQQEMCAA